MLQNQLVRLRALEPTDVDILYSWENDMEIWQVSNTHVPFSRYLLLKYIENAALDIYQTQELRLLIEENETAKPIGLIDLFDFDPFHSRAGIGIMLHHVLDRRKGYAYNAVQLFVKYAFEVLCLNQLYCNIGAQNADSLNLFTKAGFKLIGEKKKWNKTPLGWEDEWMFQLLRRD